MDMGLNENGWNNSSYSFPDTILVCLGFDGLYGFLNQLKPVLKIISRFAQYNLIAIVHGLYQFVFVSCSYLIGYLAEI
jgi:hypothetical protein